jgi:hypothetical protein
MREVRKIDDKNSSNKREMKSNKNCPHVKQWKSTSKKIISGRRKNKLSIQIFFFYFSLIIC